jgi:hypothetical protein
MIIATEDTPTLFASPLVAHDAAVFLLITADVMKRVIIPAAAVHVVVEVVVQMVLVGTASSVSHVAVSS